AITLGRPKRVLLAIGGSGRRSHLHLHQPLRGKADHLAQKISIRRLLHEGSQVHHVVGHRWSFRNGVGVATRPYRKAPMTTDMPLARYSAVNGALASGFVIAELHHLMGHDRSMCRWLAIECLLLIVARSKLPPCVHCPDFFDGL